MNLAPRLLASTALPLVALGQPAWAEVTPGQVWDAMESYMESFGYEITATEAETGDGLTVSDIRMVVTIPDEDGSVIMTMPSMTLRDAGSGTVEIVFPAEMPIVMEADAEGEGVKIAFDITQSGMKTLVSGEPGNMTYDYSADTVTMALGDLVAEGTPIPKEVAKFVMTMSGLTGKNASRTADLVTFTQDFNVAQVTYDFSFADPEGSGSGMFKGSLDNLASTGTTTLAPEFDPEDMAANFAAGFGVTGSFSYENGQSNFNVTEDGTTTVGETSTASSSLNFEMHAGKMAYGGVADQVRLMFTGGEVPFPVELVFGRVGANFAMPLDTEAVGDFGLGVQLVDFVVPDIVWAMGDPGGQLPHDPATVTFDIAGRAKPLVDIFDPEAMAAVEDSDEVPAEFESLTLSDLRVSAVGAELVGEGDFTFDNSDKETFDGMPRPIGALNMRLTGANALIDTLIAMGLVKAEDAMGARMMMSMFTVPDGDDVLKSTIEVNDQGHVLANGQRIQ